MLRLVNLLWLITFVNWEVIDQVIPDTHLKKKIVLFLSVTKSNERQGIRL